MFTKCDFKTLELNDGNIYVGIIHWNDNFLNRGQFVRPFIRDLTVKKIAKIGKRDYNVTDNFIISALNDYYKRISSAKSENERKIMLTNYNRLYQSWTILNQSKMAHQYKMMEDTYDEISYQLYLLGYKMSNS